MERIVDWGITTVKKPDQLAVRFKLTGGGWTSLTRLRYADGRRILPGADKVEVKRAAIALLQDYLEMGTLVPQRTKYKTCAEAMEYYLTEHRRNHPRDHAIEGNSKSFIEHFNKEPLSAIHDRSAKSFIENLISKGYSYDTVRLRIAAPSAMITWLETNGHWHTRNPFKGLIKQYENRFKAEPPEKAVISDDEYSALIAASNGTQRRQVRIFIQVAYTTGLRIEEIKNLDTALLDRDALTWGVYVTKTRGREIYRKIAVTRSLVTFLANEGVSGKLPLTTRLDKLFREVRAAAGLPADLTKKTFRKDFAHRMETAGASPDLINLHQGRFQNGVIFSNYLTDPGRAARLCRPFINAMFGEATEIKRVK